MNAWTKDNERTREMLIPVYGLLVEREEANERDCNMRRSAARPEGRVTGARTGNLRQHFSVRFSTDLCTDQASSVNGFA